MSDDFDLWSGTAADEIIGKVRPNQVITTHSEKKCRGHHCVLHNPSDHHMRDWPTVYRADKWLMERTCEHGVGHPDPDDLAWHVSQGRDYLGVHGCDGCCRGT